VKKKDRDIEVFSLSFLDCICCGFGAMILLFVLSKFGEPAALEKSRVDLQGRVLMHNERFARIEQVKKFALLERDLTQADGELTPTMKVKRAVVHDRYAEAIDDLYEARPDA